MRKKHYLLSLQKEREKIKRVNLKERRVDRNAGMAKLYKQNSVLRITCIITLSTIHAYTVLYYTIQCHVGIIRFCFVLYMYMIVE